MALGPGTRLGVYEVISLLGSGGMGEVYRAKDTKLGREVALKILPATFTNDPERLARFRREAQVLASLNHPHIAAIYGLDEADGTQFLVLELVDGESLDKRIARGKIPVDEALGIATQIAEALEAAHERGIIHRDLKPANIALTRDGNVKVLDFGLAKATEPASGGPFEMMNSPTITSPAMMTGIGVILGTAAYMSPEQARGVPVDARSDVFAFGCVLYEMVTGQRAFQGNSVADVLASVLARDPDFSSLPPNADLHLRNILRRCLDKNPRQRWHAIGDVRVDIEQALATPTPMDDRSVARRTISPLQTVAVILTVGALGIVGYLVGRRVISDGPGEITRLSFVLPQDQRFSGISRRMIGISPDGRQIVYAANDRLFVRALSQPAARAISGVETLQGILEPVFSPDSQSIAFYAGDRTIKRVSSGGGVPITLAQTNAPLGMSWNPSGILLGGIGAIRRVDPNGGTPTVLIELGANEMAFGPRMLPGDRAVLFTLLDQSGVVDMAKARVVVQVPGSKDRHVIADGATDARYTATGHVVYAAGGVLFARRFDSKRLEAYDAAAPVLEGVERAVGNVGSTTALYELSSTGTLILIPGSATATAGQRQLVSIDRTGAETPLKLPPGLYDSPRISPDGKQLAVSVDDGKQENIYVYELAGTTTMRQLTFEGRNRNPLWSPDGQYLLFQSDREGDRSIWRQRADGTGRAERLTKPDAGTAHQPEAFLPRTDTFSFSVVEPTEGATLRLFSISDRKAVPFGQVRSNSPLNSDFSPDGHWIAYTVRGSALAPGASVFVQPVPPTGAIYRVPVSGGHHPEWSRDGTHLLVFPGPDLLVSVPVTTRAGFAFGEPKQIAGAFAANTSTLSGRNHDLTPDGSTIISVRLGGEGGRSVVLTGIAQRIDVILNWTEELQQRLPAK